MKYIHFLLAFFLPQLLLAHGSGHEHDALKHWTLPVVHKTIEASFLMYKDGDIYLEDTRHTVDHFPLTAFSADDQAFLHRQIEKLEALNRQLQVAQQPARRISPPPATDTPGWLWALMLPVSAGCAVAFWRKRKRAAIALATLGLAVTLYGFKTDIARKLLGTDPAFLDSAFAPFKPAIHTFSDANYFYVESKGIPDHEMMTGIISWQQQVPIPQCYIGTNAWPIPLNPEIAQTPVPVNPLHFIRGAIAVAANGVPIFNPYTNTGVDAFLDGQLDNFGGHSGRADDYHYHTAPLHLDAKTPDILPIAFALDGFAVYAGHEPDGSPMSPLDANHGHYGSNGVYHYHGTTGAPYMIGNMVGKVTEDNTMQIIPQAHANPVRPALTPLKGATITDCTPNNTYNGYVLTYTKDGQTYYVDYSWTPAGVYTFKFISPNGTTTQNYNGFMPCQIPIATEELFGKNLEVTVSPNPARSGFALKINGQEAPEEILAISIFDSAGRLVFQTTQLQEYIPAGALSKGIYWVKLRLRNGEISRKVIIL